MVDDNAGRVLVYNGEIYNYKQLRQSLIAKGHNFATNSDTEVLLRLAHFDSLDWLNQLIGMFAFALWDEQSRRLLLVRDRFGKKPLYYANLPDVFVFASEIKPLLLHPAVRATPNIERIPEFLAFRSICGNQTMFRTIEQVPPGHVLIVKQEDLRIQVVKYWEDGEEKADLDLLKPGQHAKDQLAALLLDAVRYRLVSDVPVGTYNSGGVDSSLVTALVRTQVADDLHTFSVGFKEQAYDESKYAKLVANTLNTRHHSLIIGETEYVENIEQTLWYLEEPLTHPHTVQLLLLSKFAREHVTVVLTGEGADEVFGGYPRYHIPLLAHRLWRVPRVLSGALLRMSRLAQNRRLTKLFETLHSTEQSMIDNARFVPKSDLDAMFPSHSQAYPCRDEILAAALAKNVNFLEKLLCYDRRTYLPPLLNRLDKMSMAAGLEARTPYLDHRLVNWSRSLPPDSKVKLARENKVILKYLAARWFPDRIVYRRKVGFGVPLRLWLRNDKGLGRYLEVLMDHTFRERGYFDHALVGRLVDEHLRQQYDHSEILWGLMNLELWCRRFSDRANLIVDDLPSRPSAVASARSMS